MRAWVGDSLLTDPETWVATLAGEIVGLISLEEGTVEVNGWARRFYERHGFEVVELNDGSNNEERQPEVRYVWR